MNKALLDALGHITTGTITTIPLQGGEKPPASGQRLVEKGVRLPGLYRMNDEAKARYEAWKKQG